MEAEGNPIRAIFAVDMLNEGWDVLNLFDIVRLYSTKKDKKTTQEAQLIGRGARYCPFVLREATDADADPEVRYKRKFDDDIGNPLRVCETLYYHCQGDNDFIRELNNELVKTGAKGGKKPVQLTLKDKFKESTLYQEGSILLNKQESCQEDIPKALEKERYSYYLGATQVETRRLGTEASTSSRPTKHSVLEAKELGYAVLRTAIQRTEGFTHKYLKDTYINLSYDSMRAYAEAVLYPLRIRIDGRDHAEVKNLTQAERLEVASYFVRTVKDVIDKKAKQMKGTPFTEYKPIKKIFKDTKIVSEKRAVYYDGKHHAYGELYLTEEEQDFLSFLDGYIDKVKAYYQETYILRNERFFKIYNFQDGRAFEPDFVLFANAIEKGKPPLVVQCFIEPKGDHIQDGERWKEDFLEAIEECTDHTKMDIHGIRLVGLPFYSGSQETEFIKEFEKAFKLDDDE